MLYQDFIAGNISLPEAPEAIAFYLEYSIQRFGGLTLLYDDTIFFRLFNAFIKSNNLAIDLIYLLVQEKIELTDIKNLAGDQSTNSGATLNKQTNQTQTGYTAFGNDTTEPYIKASGATDNDQTNTNQALNFNILKNMYMIYDIDFTDLFKKIDKQLLQLLQTLYSY